MFLKSSIMILESSLYDLRSRRCMQQGIQSVEVVNGK
jgi:hypothetical protein